MQVFFDDIIFRLQQAGGISRIYSEVLPLLAQCSSGIELFQVSPEPSPAGLPRDPRLRLVHPTLPRGVGGLAPRLPWPVLAELEARSVHASPEAIWHSTYYYVPAGWRGPRVVFVCDLVQELFPDLFDRPWDHLVRFQKRRAILAADHLLCISVTTRDDLVRFYGLDSSRITVAHLGCNSRFGANGPADEARDDEADVLSARLPERFFLYLGSRAHYKNFRTVLQGFALWPGHARAAIVAVGAPWLNGERAEIGHLGIEDRVLQLDRVDDTTLVHLYRAAAALLYPSLYEGFGLPLLEAMASGCPIIASRIPSTLEVAGDVPLYFEPKDPGQLARVFQKVWETGRDPRRAEEGRLRAEGFSWGATAAKFLDVYRGLS